MKVLVTNDLGLSDNDQRRFSKIRAEHDTVFIKTEDSRLPQRGLPGVLKVFGLNRIGQMIKVKSDVVIVTPYNFYVTPIMKMLGRKVIYYYGDKITLGRCQNAFSNSFTHKLISFIIYLTRRVGQVISLVMADLILSHDVYMDRDAKQYNDNTFRCDARVDLDMFTPGYEENFRTGNIQVLFSGKYQGEFEGIREFFEIVKECKDIRFILVGMIPEEYEKFISKFSNLDYYRSLPYSVMPYVYCSSDVCLDLYRDKKVTGSQTINEALACGVPIVGFNHNQTILKEGNSFLYDNIDEIIYVLYTIRKHNHILDNYKRVARISMLPYDMKKNYLKLRKRGDKIVFE